MLASEMGRTDIAEILLAVVDINVNIQSGVRKIDDCNTLVVFILVGGHRLARLL